MKQSVITLFLFATFAHAAVSPAPQPSTAIVCQVLDGSKHEQEWLTHEDALVRVDVLHMLGVDVQLRCRDAHFSEPVRWALVEPTYTHHFPRDKGMNDRNWGLAVERQVKPWLWLLAEDYDNSYRRNTLIVGASLLPLHWGPVRAGSAVGVDLTRGYRDNPVKPLIGDARAIVRLNQRVSVGIDVLPGPETAIAVSMRYNLFQKDYRRAR